MPIPPPAQAVKIMSEEHKAPEPASQTGDLLGQVLGDRQPEASPVEEKGEGEKSEPEQAPTDDKKEGDDGTATPEGEAPKEDKPDDGQQKTVKLGNREFQSAEEALKEANRVVGHNANLASEVSTYKTKVSELEAKVQEALEANAKWAEWAEANAKGEETEKPNTPKLEEVVRKVLEERDNRDQMKTVEQQMKTEVEKLQTFGNFDEALPMLKDLADKTNPQTGKNFTPYEAYEYTCWKLGLENELTKKEPTKPVSPAEGAMKAASRPAGTPKSPAPKQEEQKRDDVDEMISRYF